MTDSRKRGIPLTDISTDREARLVSVLEQARSYCNAVEARLALAGGLAQQAQPISAELTWRVLLAQTILQVRSLDASMNLLAHAREDVAAAHLIR
jgi:hypothetical protein